MFGLTGGTALPQWTERLRGRKPELFFAALSVDGDTEQLMDRNTSKLKLGPACGEQKVFTTHEFAGKGNLKAGCVRWKWKVSVKRKMSLGSGCSLSLNGSIFSTCYQSSEDTVLGSNYLGRI